MKLSERFFSVCERVPKNIAFSSEVGKITYRTMREDVEAMDRHLEELGIRPGDRVAISSATPYLVFTIELACSSRGVTIVFLESYISPSTQEWEAAIKGAAAHWAITFDQGGQPVWKRTDIPHDLPQGEEILPSRHVLLHARTSGTTGQPKGVCLSEDALLQAIDNTIQISNCSATSKGMLLYEPLGLISQICAFSTFLSGATLVDGLLFAQKPGEIPAFIERHRVTHAVLVPQHIGAALSDPSISQRDLACLEVVMYGAAPVTKALIERAQALISCRWLQCYGMTETTGPVCWLGAEEQSLAGYSVGKAAPGCALQIRDTDSGAPLQPGQDGEIFIGGALLMEGYWDATLNRPVRGEEFVDGWLSTGDLGHLTADNHLILKGRAGEEIVSTLGYTIHPSEIEDALRDLPDIVEVAALGYRLNDVGVVPIAVCHIRGSGHDAAISIKQALHAKLDRSKHPNYIVVSHQALPRGSNGKVQKGRLKELTQVADLIPV